MDNRDDQGYESEAGRGRPGGKGGGKGGDKRREMEKLIKDFYRALNRRDYGRIQEMFSDTHLDRTWFGESPVKAQAVTRIFDQMQTASPDWYETLDEILSVDEETGWVVVKATGRGSITGNILGMRGDGKQVAAPLIHCIRIVDGKFVEYRGTKPGGFENPFDDPISAPVDVQAVRAEQGGTNLTPQARERRERALSTKARGVRTPAQEAVDTIRTLAETEDPARCQALVQDTMRRCLKAAVPNSIYCELHEAETPEVHRARR